MKQRGTLKGKLVISVCTMCSDDYKVSKHQMHLYKTCSKYCSKLMSVKMRLKGIYVQCDMCDKLMWVEPKKFKSKNHFCSKSCDNMYRKHVKPLGTHRKTDINRKKYYGANWLEQARLARERDNYICKDCGISQSLYGKMLSVHHIIPFVYFNTYTEANRLTNLVSICEPCHRIRHSGKNHPLHYNKDKLGLNYINSQSGDVRNKHYDTAVKIVTLLTTTEYTLKDISNIVGVSYTTVARIYRGERWMSLYNKPIYITNPRNKSSVYKNK